MRPPITRLFLSADIAGSTAYKQRKMVSDVETWPSVFIKFFQGLPGYFKDSLATRSEEMRREESTFSEASAPVLWKAIGDEIVFWQDVKHEHQVAVGVMAWRDALLTFRSEFEKDSNLDVKGAAWTASFPFPNREIAVPMTLVAARMPAEPITANEDLLEHPTDHVLDFIGPNIDTGFRLAARSNPHQFQLSLEVAEILVESDLRDAKKLYYGGPVELKGVHGGRPYPTFWLDSYPGDDFATAERELLGRTPAMVDHVKKAVAAALSAAGMPHCWLPNSREDRFTVHAKGQIDEAIGKIEAHVSANPGKTIDSPDEPIDTPQPKKTIDVTAIAADIRKA